MRQAGGPRRQRRQALAAPPAKFAPLSCPACPYCAEPIRDWPLGRFFRLCSECSQILVKTPSVWSKGGKELHTGVGAIRLGVAATAVVGALFGMGRNPAVLGEAMLFFLASYGGLTMIRAAVSLFSPLMLNSKAFRKTALFRRMSRDGVLGAVIVAFSLYGMSVV